jgi:hypothetical protein
MTDPVDHDLGIEDARNQRREEMTEKVQELMHLGNEFYPLTYSMFELATDTFCDEISLVMTQKLFSVGVARDHYERVQALARVGEVVETYCKKQAEKLAWESLEC